MTREETYSLIEKHYRSSFKDLVTKLSGRFGGVQDAEDVVQDAYARACQYHDSFSGNEREFDRWFTSLLANCSRDKWGDMMRRGMTVDVDEDDRIVLNTGPFNVELTEIADQIEAKKSPHKEILTLYFWKNYDPADISNVVGEKVGTVKQVIWRFQNELRESADS